jgi:hypothetical protein
VAGALWALLAARRPLAAVAVGAASTARTASRLVGIVEAPFMVATGLSLAGTAQAAVPAVTGLTRAWGPLLVPLLLVRRLGRLRLALAGALALTATRQWQSRPPGLDPVRYVVTRVADDLAYGAGVWWGCGQARTLRPLRPAFTAARAQAGASGPAGRG